MTDLALCFADEAEYDALSLVNEPGRFDIDVIGAIWKETGTPSELVQVDGWHVNIRCRDDRDLTALESFRVYPETPSRVWA